MATAPLSPVDLLLLIQSALNTWKATLVNTPVYVSIAGDPGDIVEALTQSPSGVRVVLAWAGDEDQTGQALAGICDQKFEVWIFKARGLPISAGAALVSGAYPFLKFVSDCRAQIRKIAFPTDWTNEQILYKGSDQFEPSLAVALPTAGYKLRFELTAAIPVAG